jgi:hypothetical protein
MWNLHWSRLEIQPGRTTQLSFNKPAIAILAANLSLLSLAPAQAQPVTLGPQFSPNPTELRGVGGGSRSVGEMVGRSDSPTGPCTGFANPAPNETVVLTSFFKSLSLVVDSDEDTAVVIKGPGGIWCNDDFQGKNPGVSGQWLPGKYEIWVSTYGRGRTAPYTLRLSGTR